MKVLSFDSTIDVSDHGDYFDIDNGEDAGCDHEATWIHWWPEFKSLASLRIVLVSYPLHCF